MAFVEQDRHVSTTKVVSQWVALTAEQVAMHDLPTAPAKASDGRSKNWTGETCQLEALAPDVLADIVRDAIVQHFDLDEFRMILEREKADRAEPLGLPRGGV